MSGSNSICVATVLLEAGILPMREPETRFTLEAPGGLIAVTAECSNGKAESISLENVPVFADRVDAPLEVEGLGALKVDTAYGGDSFVIADAAALGFTIAPDEARDLAETGVRIVAAANEQLGFSHPEAGGWDHISFCQFAGPLERHGNELRGPNAVVVRRGKIDRSPTRTGCSARMATLSARGLMTERDVYRARPIIGSEFVCRIAPDHERWSAGHHADYFRPGLDYRLESVYARSGRSVALRLPARGYLATFKGGKLSGLRGSRSRLTQKWRWNTHFTIFCRSPKPILIISPEGWRKT